MRPLAALAMLFLTWVPLYAQDPPTPPVPPTPLPVPAPSPDPPPAPTPPAPPPAVPFIKAPAEIKVEVGDIIALQPETNGTQITFAVVGAGEKPPYADFPDFLIEKSIRGTTWVKNAKRPGQFTIVSVSALGGVPSPAALTVVTIGTPPAPTPTPTPDPPGPTPGPIPVPAAPSAELQALLAPLRAKTAAGDRAKALEWSRGWSAFANTFTALPSPTVARFRGDLGAFMSSWATDAGLAGAFPGYTDALNVALDARFGTSEAAIDVARATEFIRACAWAAYPQ